MSVVNNNNTYTGKVALPYIGPLVTEATALKKGLVRLVDAVNGKCVIRKAGISLTMADLAQNFTDGASATTDEVVIEPKRVQVQGLIPLPQFFETWSADAMRPGLPGSGDSELVDMWLSLTKRYIHSSLESLNFNGKGTPVQGMTFSFTGTYPGYVAQAVSNAPAGQNLLAGTTLALTGIANSGAVVTVGSTTGLMSGDWVTIDATTNGNQQYGGASIDDQTFPIKVLSSTTFALLDPVTRAAINLTGSTAATSGAVRYINQTNVQNAIVTALSTLPTRVSALRSELVVYVPDHIMLAYKKSVGEAKSLKAGYSVTRTDEGYDRLVDDVYGYRIEEIPNMAANTILVAQPYNLIWATALEADYNSISVINRYQVDHVKAISFDASFSFGGNIGFADEVAVVRA